jgi:maltose alpha-D-glucosyltransferase/alpha-amylase
MKQPKAPVGIEDDPLWYKNGVIYQLHVRSFFDRDDDGIGDFAGLTAKLDYLQDLGVTAIWLLPFYPSPLRDDGYDTANYTDVNPMYGSLADFKSFLREAHRRGLRVITELVINHTSDQHPWFQRARSAKPGSKWREFYVWSDTSEKYREARIIFKDFEPSNWSWDPVAQAYYWHRFYHHQPDLNFDKPEVHRAVFQALDFWMKLGVDGLRLDAIPYLYEREGTTCENLPETHAFLKELRAHVDANFRSRMLLAEANQWPEDASAYFGDGDECHVAFHFPLMPRLFMSVAMEDRFPIVDIMQQTPQIPDSSQWAVFLRNHDELTLEMVTDEDRDYMWKAYADDPQARINLGIRRRLAPLLGNHRSRIELMNALLFSFPGTPIIYYGDEIGMGDNIYLGDRNGVRTPMQWSSDRNAGFSRSNPQRLFLPVIIDPEYHYETVNVEAQQNNIHSLLWWTKRLIDLRKRHRAFGRGSLEFLQPENRRVLAFIREYQNERILVIANLSRFVQAAELDLSRFRGSVPLELFGQTTLPVIGDTPYIITLAPHGFYWFSIESRDGSEVAIASRERSELPQLEMTSLDELSRAAGKSSLADALSRFVQTRRWFTGRNRAVRGARIHDIIELPRVNAMVVLLTIEFRDGTSELYQLPVALAMGEAAARFRGEGAQDVIARIRIANADGVLFDGACDRLIALEILRTISSRRHPPAGARGELQVVRTRITQNVARIPPESPSPMARVEHGNTAVSLDDQLFLKIYRRLEPGINSDLEIGRFLTEETDFSHAVLLAGALEYQSEGREPVALAVVQPYLRNGGDGWHFTIGSIRRYFDEVLRSQNPSAEGRLPGAEEVSPEAAATTGIYLRAAELMGQRTAGLHLALSSRQDNPAFAPEPFTPHYQRSIYQQMRSDSKRAFPLIRKALDRMSAEDRRDAEMVLGKEGSIESHLRGILATRITATRIRCHGNLHLGKLMQTGDDFIILDFGGDPDRPLSERRIKRSALRDVASMLRSFHYAVQSVLAGQTEGALYRDEDIARLRPAAELWYHRISAAYLGSYLSAASGAGFVPLEPGQTSLLLDLYLFERALNEIVRELTGRPELVGIALRGVLDLVREWR